MIWSAHTLLIGVNIHKSVWCYPFGGHNLKITWHKLNFTYYSFWGQKLYISVLLHQITYKHNYFQTLKITSANFVVEQIQLQIGWSYYSLLHVRCWIKFVDLSAMEKCIFYIYVDMSAWWFLLSFYKYLTSCMTELCYVCYGHMS